MARCHPFIRFSTPVTSGDSPFQGHADHASQVGRHRCCGFSRNLADACGAALMRLDNYKLDNPDAKEGIPTMLRRSGAIAAAVSSETLLTRVARR